MKHIHTDIDRLYQQTTNVQKSQEWSEPVVKNVNNKTSWHYYTNLPLIEVDVS